MRADFVGKFTDDSVEEDWYFLRPGYGTRLSVAEYVDAADKSFGVRFAEAFDASWFFSMSGAFGKVVHLERLDALPEAMLENTQWQECFAGCSSLHSVPRLALAPDVCWGMFSGCGKLERVDLGGCDFSGARSIDSMFKDCGGLEWLELGGFDIPQSLAVGWWALSGCSSLRYYHFGNLGKTDKSGEMISNFSLQSWGAGGEENRRSLVRTVVEDSFDRAAAGMEPLTVKLSRDVYARLTEDERGAAALKGIVVAVK